MAKISKSDMESRKVTLTIVKESIHKVYTDTQKAESISGTQKDRITSNLERILTYVEQEIENTDKSIAKAESKGSKSAILKELKSLSADELAELKALREAKQTEENNENSTGEETGNDS